MQNQAVANHLGARGHRNILVVAVAALAAVSTTTSANGPDGAAPGGASAGPSGTRIYTLPGEEVFAYDVAVAGDTYYVTGAGKETIYRGDLDEPAAEELAADPGWGPMLGIKVVGQRLLVARGFGGTVSLHDRGTGAVVARWTN